MLTNVRAYKSGETGASAMHMHDLTPIKQERSVRKECRHFNG